MITQSLKQIKSFSTLRLFAAGSSILHRSFSSATSIQADELFPAVDDASPAQSSDSGGSFWPFYRRISQLGATGEKVSPFLNECVWKGHEARKLDLLRCVKELRKQKRHQNCLEIFEWLDRRGEKYTYTDLAMRLDIIGKTRGITAAENFFNSLTSEEKNMHTYGALLNCYVNVKLSVKAAELVKEMEKLNFVTGLTFTNLITLAVKTGEPEKVPGLVEEMKKRGFGMSTYTYSMLLQSYQLINDMEAVDRTVQEIEDGGKNCHWSLYSNLVSVYLRDGNAEKAEMALKKLEESAKTLKYPEHAVYEYLLSYYAELGNSAEVMRVWKDLKSAFKNTSSASYMFMLKALMKLNDLDELLKCYKEWESGYQFYCKKVPFVVLEAYLRENKIHAAEQLLNYVVEKSKSPFLKGRERLMAYFLDKGEIVLALKQLEAIANGISWARYLKPGHSKAKPDPNKGKPDPERILEFFKYFEKEKDVQGAEKLMKLLRQMQCFNMGSYLWLLRTYEAAGKTCPNMRKRIELDGFQISSEEEGLLEKVCPE